ncbi:SpoVG family protein [bacterium]|nr:SpoVG family protein [bacterium]
MEVTEVRISLRDDDKLCGFANIILDNTFVVRGLKIICGVDRYFVAMPSRRKRDGSFADIAHPITSEFRKKMEKAVIDAYWKEVEESRARELKTTDL